MGAYSLFALNSVIDFFGYQINIYSVIIYAVVFLLTFQLLYHYRFSRFHAAVLALISIFFLESVWELPFWFMAIPTYTLKWFGSALLGFRTLIANAGSFLWITYALRFGNGKLLALFSIGVLVDIIIFYRADFAHFLAVHLPFSVRLLWAILLLVNVQSWRVEGGEEHEN